MATFLPPTAIAASPSENAPLLPPILVRHDALPSNFRIRSQSYQIRMLLCSTVRLHWLSLSLSAVSAACYLFFHRSDWRSENQIVITVACVGLFVSILSFMGFRGARESDRRVKALQAMNKMFSAFWSIYTFLPNESRAKVKEPFIASFKSIARHLSVVSSHGNYWFAILGLAPAHRFQSESTKSEEANRLRFFKALHGDSIVSDDSSQDQHIEAVPAPRLQLLATLMLVEEEIRSDWRDADNPGGVQSTCGHLWQNKALLIESHDELVALVIPPTGNAQVAFHNAVMLIASLMLPWAFPPQYLDIFSAASIGRLRMLAVMFVFMDVCLVLLLYMCDVLTHMCDNPFAASSLDDQICFEDCVEALSMSVEGYDQRHRMAEQRYGAVGNVCLGSQTFHSFMCAEQIHKNVAL